MLGAGMAKYALLALTLFSYQYAEYCRYVTNDATKVCCMSLNMRPQPK